MKTTVIKELPKNFFDQMENFLMKSYDEILSKHTYGQRENVLIYIPSYIMRMYSAYHHETHRWSHNEWMVNRFMGIDIKDGYENFIVITFTGAVERGIEPFKLQIP